MLDGLQPAAAVIEKCGGIEATAKLVDRHRSVVNRWLLPRESGGTGGRIPMHHAHTLLAAVPALTEADFFRADAASASKTEAA
jgi:hypothetical protein